MRGDETAGERSRHLSDVLRRRRIAEDVTRRAVRSIVTHDASDRGQETTQCEAHRKAQHSELRAVGDENLRYQ
jgi:hypothetical protein